MSNIIKPSIEDLQNVIEALQAELKVANNEIKIWKERAYNRQLKLEQALKEVGERI